MNLLRSAELLLYEVVSWLVFYPLTLWRCIRRPMAMIAYAEQELTRPPEDQFSEALSPPIFLFLTLMIAHMVQSGIFHNDAAFEGVLADQRNLLILRAVAFSLFPLLLGIQHVRLSGQTLSRRTLRPMFYAQCYVTVPFVLALDLAMMLHSLDAGWSGPTALAIFLIGLGWYAVALTRGFMIHRNTRRSQAIGQTALAIVIGGVCFFGVFALSLLSGPVTIGS
ncbi:MFS transporter permease [Cereibacter changlensis]|nr:MFS transporter permease [Cereibacter changlensis]